MKKLLSIILALLMVLQLVPVSVFADDADTGYPKKPEVYYVAIGDSVCSGFGLEGDSELLSSIALFIPVLLELPEDDEIAKALAENLRRWHGVDFAFNIRNINVPSYSKLVGEAMLKAVTGNSNVKFTDEDDSFSKVTYANLGAPGYVIEDFYEVLLPEGEYVKDQSSYDASHICGFWDFVNELLPSYLVRLFQWSDAMRTEVIEATNITFNVGANDALLSFLWAMESDEFKDNDLMSIINLILYMGMLGFLDNVTSLDDLAPIIDGGLFASNNEAPQGESFLDSIDIEELLPQIMQCLKFFSTKNMTKVMLDGIENTMNPTGENIDEFLKNGYQDNEMGIKREYGYFDATIDEIYRMNPDVELAIVGSFNPFSTFVNHNGKVYTRGQVTGVLIKELLEAALAKVLGRETKHNLTKDLALTESVVDELRNNETVLEYEFSNKDAEEDALSKSILDFAMSIICNTISGATDKALSRLNSYAKKVAEKYDVPFIYPEDQSTSVLSFSVHPNKNGHEEIANAIINTLVSDIILDDNLSGDTLRLANSDLKKQAVVGQIINLKVPAGAEYLVVNNERVWDSKNILKNALNGRTVEVKVTEPQTFIYAHYKTSGLTKTKTYNTVIGGEVALSNGSYIDKLAQRTGLRFHVLGRTTTDTAELLTALGHNKGLTTLQPDETVASLGKYKVSTNVAEGLNYKAALRNSKTVILDLGANDAILNLIASFSERKGFSLRDVDLSKVNDFNNLLLNGIGGKLTKELTVPGIKLLMNEDLLDIELGESLKVYKQNMTQIAAELDKNLEKGAKVYAIGFYNPFGKDAKNEVAEANTFLKSLMKAYGWEYVDVSNAWSDLAGKPTGLGSEYMALKLLGAIIF